MLFAAVHESLLAHSGHSNRSRECPLLGVKRTWIGREHTAWDFARNGDRNVGCDD